MFEQEYKSSMDALHCRPEVLDAIRAAQAKPQAKPRTWIYKVSAGAAAAAAVVLIGVLLVPRLLPGASKSADSADETTMLSDSADMAVEGELKSFAYSDSTDTAAADGGTESDQLLGSSNDASVGLGSVCTTDLPTCGSPCSDNGVNAADDPLQRENAALLIASALDCDTDTALSLYDELTAFYGGLSIGELSRATLTASDKLTLYAADGYIYDCTLSKDLTLLSVEESFGE